MTRPVTEPSEASEAAGLALRRLAARPAVAAAVAQAREACTALRWHPGLRRRGEPARAEATVRAARASAALAGARWPVALLREAVAGARPYPADAAGATVQGAVRCLAQAQRLENSYATTVSQTLAALHLAAAGGLLPAGQLGRPRAAGEPPGDGGELLDATGAVLPAPDGAALTDRLRALAVLLAAPADVPALVVAALAQAEVATIRPFAAGNGVVARALCRTVVVARGLDPTGVAVWEAGLLAAGPALPQALAGYATGDPEGVDRWLTVFAAAVVEGAAEGGRVAEAVLAGRTG